MNTALNIAKYIFSLSNFILIACIAYFSQGLQWSNEKDRPSIVGFTWMALTVAGSVVLIWI